MTPIYLDYNATTPIDPLVAEAMHPYLGRCFGNPSSTHPYGMEAKKALEHARTQVASLLHADPDEIIFTSGGTESNNYALKGATLAPRSRGNHIITSATEHPAVLEVCRYLETIGFQITLLPVDGFGMVNPDDLVQAITPATVLISVMHANNEVGTIQPIEHIGEIANSYGIVFHTDAAQSIGKIRVDARLLKAGLISVAGHKMYAPKGIGALYVRRGIILNKLMHGADHEGNRRAGTENVPEIVGFGVAADLIRNEEFRIQDEKETATGAEGDSSLMDIYGIKDLRDRLFEGIRDAIPEVRLNGHPDLHLPNTLSLGFPGIDAATLLNEMKGIAASAGAACHSGQAEVSGVLAAMNVPLEFARGTIRFSLGRTTSSSEIEFAVREIVGACRRLKPTSGEFFFPPLREAVNDNEPDQKTMLPEIPGELPGIRKPESGPFTQERDSSLPDTRIRLTGYTISLGCACKIRPQLLEKILNSMPLHADPSLLTGYETSDDAAVYRISKDTAIVQTVDFIPPVVDDPHSYGAIAAANALSDIYAMGAKPLFALSVVGFPEKKLPSEVLQEILHGAKEKTWEAGIQIVGGHTIDDHEPKFGLVVTGTVHPDRIIRNSTAKQNDVLILTKPVGSGILTTAIKRGLADQDVVREVTGVMERLNNTAAAVMSHFPVSACTDVTGYGLLGHLKEMVIACGLTAEIGFGQVPVMRNAWRLMMAGMVPGGTLNNLHYTEDITEWESGLSDHARLILCDAQTSGGLLIALPDSFADSLIGELHQSGITEAAVIGKFKGKGIRIKILSQMNWF